MEAIDFLFLIGSRFMQPPAQETLVVSHSEAGKQVTLTCKNGPSKSICKYTDGTDNYQRKVFGTEISVDFQMTANTLNFRWDYRELTITCYAHTASIDISGGSVSRLILDYSATAQTISPVITIGESAKMLKFIDLSTDGQAGSAYSQTAINHFLTQLTAVPANLQNNGFLNLAGHSLNSQGQAMRTILENKGWYIVSDNNEMVQFQHGGGVFTVYSSGNNMVLGDTYVAYGVQISTNISNPKWYGPASAITKIQYNSCLITAIPAALEPTLKGIEIIAYLDLIDAIRPAELDRFVSLESFLFSGPISPKIIYTGMFKFPNHQMMVKIQRISGYGIDFTPRDVCSLDGVHAVNARSSTNSALLILNPYTETPLSITGSSSNITFQVERANNLALPDQAKSLLFLTSKGIKGKLSNVGKLSLISSTIFNISGQAVREIELPESNDVWPLIRYDFSGNALCRETMDGLIDFLAAQTWGSGKTFDLQNQIPYQSPGPEAIAKITSGQVKAAVLYNPRSDYDIELQGAGTDLYNSCYKLGEYDHTDPTIWLPGVGVPGATHIYKYGRYFHNGAGYNIFEVDVDRNTEFAGQYRYVIKAWVITVLTTWQESLGPSFLNASYLTYKIINQFEQWNGDELVHAISEPVRNAGSGMGAVPTLTLLK